MITSLIVSTIAYFVAAHYIKRYLDDSGIPRGTTRNLLVFSLAALVSYGVAAMVTHL